MFAHSFSAHKVILILNRVNHMMELDRLRALEKEREKAEEKKRDDIELKSQLQRQIEELKIKEEESEMLRKEEEELVKRKSKIDAAVSRFELLFPIPFSILSFLFS